jgi:catechol 2,3-dioxygenase-like lactoylglutathione lyase family enzyme
MSNEASILGVGQISRTVSDIARSEAWYRDAVGLPHLFTFNRLAFFEIGGTRLMLTQEDQLQPAESIIYLRVRDVHVTHQAMQQRGIAFTQPPHMIHRHENGSEEWMAFFNDPDGRPLAIMATVVSPAAH